MAGKKDTAEGFNALSWASHVHSSGNSRDTALVSMPAAQIAGIDMDCGRGVAGSNPVGLTS